MSESVSDWFEREELDEECASMGTWVGVIEEERVDYAHNEYRND